MHRLSGNRIGVAVPIVCLLLVTQAGCLATRWIDRFTTFHVNPTEAARIDDLDARSPSGRSSKDWIEYTSDKPRTEADCQYWRAVALNVGKDTDSVRQYVDARKSSSCSAYADVFEAISQAEFEQRVAKATERMKDEGEPLHGDLDPLEPIHISLERGKCYELVLRVEQGFVATPEAKKYARFDVFSEGAKFEAFDLKPTDAFNGGTIEGHGAVIHIGCPTVSGAIRIQSKPSNIAKGRYVAQVRTAPHSDADYEADRVALANAAKESAGYTRLRLQEVCAACAEDLRDCVASPPTPSFDCKGDYAQCLEVNASAHPADCAQ